MGWVLQDPGQAGVAETESVGREGLLWESYFRWSPFLMIFNESALLDDLNLCTNLYLWWA